MGVQTCGGRGGGKSGFEDFGRGNQMDFKGEWRGLRPDLQSTNRGGYRK